MSLITVEIVRGADVWDFTDQIDWTVSQLGGFGMAPLHRLEHRGPMQHGDTDDGYRLDPAITTLAIIMAAESLADQYVLRASIIEAFKPGSALILRVTLPSGAIRCRECHYLRGLDFDSAQFEGWQGNVVVQLKSGDPTWYDPTGEATTFALGGGAGTAGVVPFTVPWYVGVSTLDASYTIDYDGTWLTYPTIRVTGPIRDCIITNEGTDETLDLTGTTIGAGTYIDLDLRYGYKTVEDSSGANQIAILSTDSDLATWHLAPDPELADGLNAVSVVGSDVSEATVVALSWFERFIGV